MKAHDPQYPEALRKAEEFVRTTLAERRGSEPGEDTVRAVAKKVVKALPSFDGTENRASIFWDDFKKGFAGWDAGR